MKIKYFDHPNKLHLDITAPKEQKHCYKHEQLKTGAIVCLVLHWIKSGKTWTSCSTPNEKQKKQSDKRNQLTGMHAEMQTGTCTNEIISKTHHAILNHNALQHHYWTMSSHDICHGESTQWWSLWRSMRIYRLTDIRDDVMELFPCSGLGIQLTCHWLLIRSTGTANQYLALQTGAILAGKIYWLEFDRLHSMELKMCDLAAFGFFYQATQ